MWSCEINIVDMNSRDKILAAVKSNQPAYRELPDLSVFVPGVAAQDAAMGESLVQNDLAKNFTTLLTSIGGAVYTVTGFDSVARILREQFPDAGRVVTNCAGLAEKHFVVEFNKEYDDPHSLEDIDLSVLHAHFGVAENGACWITEDRMIQRVVPFICQHLALVIDKKNIVANMHEAYDRIAVLEASGLSYGFATFIAGPSKTADIEQSLVLGAHGPRSMTVFLLDAGLSDAGFY